jgi:hypothetical protein
MHKTSGSLGPAFPVDFNSAGGIILWLATHSWELFIHGRVCSSENNGLMPLAGNDEVIELNNDMLQGLAELLRNETAANILHSIKLPPDVQNKTMVKPYDGKSCSRGSSTYIDEPRFYGCRWSTA